MTKEQWAEEMAQEIMDKSDAQIGKLFNGITEKDKQLVIKHLKNLLRLRSVRLESNLRLKTCLS